MGYYYWDPTYILVVIGAVICMIASARVKGTFNKYSQLRSMSGMNGAQVAQRVLQAAGIYDVQVRHVSGSLTDHYDPRTKTVNLSDPVYNATSVAALGVAAHECGHAIQHAKSYAPLSIRSALVPIANFGSMLALAFRAFEAMHPIGAVVVQKISSKYQRLYVCRWYETQVLFLSF